MPKKSTTRASGNGASRRGTPRKRAAATAASGAGADTVRVRMFNVGQGDCFLLSFNLGTPEVRHVMIDCGTLGSSASGGDAVDEALRAIVRTLDDEPLSAIIATHEHKDHVSGFTTSRLKKFKLAPRQVWMAWTENPEDPDAQKVKRNADDLRAAIGAALAIGGASVESPGFELLGMDDRNFARQVDEWMRNVAKQGSPPRFLSPGDLLADAIPGFRVYVLGPPRDAERLKLEGSHGDDELYGLVGAMHAALDGSEQGAFAGDVVASAYQIEDGQRPFDKRYCRSPAQAARDYPVLYDPDEAWRDFQIDWTDAAMRLALQADRMINNSSLVLAFERVRDGTVLLFPGDAQLGNWQSWHDRVNSWTLRVDGREQTVTTDDLLSRTVFLKVAHHGSHNATMRTGGLESMRSPRLTAFIPVDRAVARRKAWSMPAMELYKRLLEKCDGRVVRSDTGWAHEKPGVQGETELRQLFEEPRWNEWARRHASSDQVGVDPGGTYVDFTLR